MAVLGCAFCGFGIHYHGEPEGTEPVDHYFCKLDNWRELEKENLTADYLELEHEEFFIYAWRCKRCGSFSFFSDGIHVSGFYIPKENFSSEPMKEPFEFGPFWNDFQWFAITEDDITAAEVLKKYPDNFWLVKNDDELRIYKDEARTNCVAQFKRFHRPEIVTVQTMSLDSFKKMFANWDDVEFFYHDVYYNFMREDDGTINIWRGQGYTNSVYSAATTDVEEIINYKIFDDGKSIAEVPAEVIL